MNHTIKGIILVVVITSMLFVGASMFPIMQNSFASKKHDFKGADPDTNTNTNTNTADSTSSSTAAADNTNNITNTATASNSQEQSVCAVAVTCPEGITSIDLVLCPHPPYTDFVAGVGCQDGAPQTTCNPSTVGISGATPTDDTCTASINAGIGGTTRDTFIRECMSIPGADFSVNGPQHTRDCTFPSTQTCPPPSGSTQTPTVVNGRCTIQPGAT